MSRRGRDFGHNYEYVEEEYYYGPETGGRFANGTTGHTGDPRLDIEYEKGYGGSGTFGGTQAGGGAPIPDSVQEFLLYLYKSITERNVFEIQNLYDTAFVQLTDTYYKTDSWPEEDAVLGVVGDRDNYEVFIIFYRELYYRHIYARCQPNIHQRFESYYNYCRLFNLILSADEPVPLELPNQWLWDIIDEFIYQFQSFSLYRLRANTGKLEGDEFEQVKENPKVWNVHSVLNVLHSLVDKSKINEQLREFNAGRDPNVVADIFGKQDLYKMLGYFSLIGLLRLHSLLGDYYQAIKILDNIDIHRHQPSLQNISLGRVLACQMTTFYYVGFAYMMMRRYSDAIRTFSNMLVYLQRTRQIYHPYRTLQVDMIDKQTEQMYGLLTLCLVLHPQRIDESVSSMLQEKCSELIIKLQRGDLKEFENTFKYACPKFLSPVAVVSEPVSDTEKSTARFEPLKQQLKVFMDEVQQQLPVLNIRSFLKLYTTMPIEKLATFLDVDKESFQLQLLCFKHKMINFVWTKNKGHSGLDGEFSAGSDVDFYIDKDMIHIADTKVARRYGDYFLRQIHKFEELYRAVGGLRV